MFVDDFFCVDPQSLSDEQLEHYGEEMRRCECLDFKGLFTTLRDGLVTDMEKENFERIRSDCSARMHACQSVDRHRVVHSREG